MVLFLGFFDPPSPLRGSIHISEHGFFLQLFGPPEDLEDCEAEVEKYAISANRDPRHL